MIPRIFMLIVAHGQIENSIPVNITDDEPSRRRPSHRVISGRRKGTITCSEQHRDVSVVFLGDGKIQSPIAIEIPCLHRVRLAAHCVAIPASPDIS